MTASRPKEQTPALRQLAHHYGIQTTYVDMTGERHNASPEALLATLLALDEDLAAGLDPAAVLLARQLDPWRRRVEPVAVLWHGGPTRIEYHLPPDRPASHSSFLLRREDGQTMYGSFDPDRLGTLREVEVGDRRLLVKELLLPGLLPVGYHHLTLLEGVGRYEMMLIVAPLRAYEPPQIAAETSWGVFLPLYSLHTRRSWGAGDLTDFEALIEWAQGRGASVVATLPLLAAFLDVPFDPSPYVPASRLFWNEFYIDLERSPELEHSPAARALLESDEYRKAIRKLRAQPRVDYRTQWELKRRVLEALAATFFASPPSARRDEFERFRQANPRLEDYAAFRATCTRQQAPWPVWPERQRGGELRPGDYDQADYHTYLYAQWLVQQQLGQLSEKARQVGFGLYLDLPLGVHPDSYDVWREPTTFAQGVSGGAPPDAFFSKGQDWGFRPLHPHRLREQHYRYMITCLDQHMRQAGVLRIDHVMGLHRLFWVPAGMEATEGVYVQYHAEELHAILNIESHRHRSLIVGEDLGTVPDHVRRALGRHNIHRMFVTQFSVEPDPHQPIAPVIKDAVASLNTHDMPTFAGFWAESDITDQVEMGLLDVHQEREARRHRAAIRKALSKHFRPYPDIPASNGAHAPADPAEDPLPLVLEGALRQLSQGPASLVLVSLEDLWGELQPQNVPGTSTERPNWQHRARHGLEDFAQLASVRRLLGEVDRLRKEG